MTDEGEITVIDYYYKNKSEFHKVLVYFLSQALVQKVSMCPVI